MGLARDIVRACCQRCAASGRFRGRGRFDCAMRSLCRRIEALDSSGPDSALRPTHSCVSPKDCESGSDQASTNAADGLRDALDAHAHDPRGDQARILLRSIPLGVIGGLASTAALAWILRRQISSLDLGLWLAANIFAHGLVLAAWFYGSAEVAQNQNARRSLLVLRMAFFALGCGWAVLPTVFASSTPFNRLLASMIIAAITGAGVAQIASDAVASALYMLPPAVAATIPLFTSSNATLQSIGPLGVLYFGFLFVATLRIQASYLELSRMRGRATLDSLRDGLTGLPNRQALITHLQAAIARGRRAKTEVLVGYIDLDNFKQINDSFGHDAGDKLLKEVAGRWRSQVRASELIARLGGDEFVFIVDGLAPGKLMHQLGPVVERLHREVERPIDIGEHRFVEIGMTMGVARFPIDGAEPEVLLRRADRAMYELKQDKETRPQWWKLCSADEGAVV